MPAKACLNVDKNELLREAAAAGDAEQVQLLLAQGANLNSADAEGWTALHWSCSNVHVAQILLQRGAAVDAADKQGKTTLHWAATDGHAGKQVVLALAPMTRLAAAVAELDSDDLT